MLELYNEYNRLDYSGFKEEIAAATCHHFVFGFCDKTGHDEDVEKHIPKPLKEYIYDSIFNIRADFANQTLYSDLTNDEKHWMENRLDKYHDGISHHLNSMLALFSDHDHYWCPFGCQHSDHSRLNIPKHLEQELCHPTVRDDRYNFHFMFAVFMANLPNRRGREIRNNQTIMNIIEAFVANEEVFDNVEKIRQNIRKEIVDCGIRGTDNNPITLDGVMAEPQLLPYKISNYGREENPIVLDEFEVEDDIEDKKLPASINNQGGKGNPLVIYESENDVDEKQFIPKKKKAKKMKKDKNNKNGTEENPFDIMD